MIKKYFIIGFLIILVDQLFKFVMINRNVVVLPNVLSLTYTENNGAAFGIGSKNIVLVVSLLLIIGIIWFIFKNHKMFKNYMPFVLIISGGIGNLIDRIFRGYVIDYIDVKFMNFPNFNFADICITIGILWIIFNVSRDFFNKKN